MITGCDIECLSLRTVYLSISRPLICSWINFRAKSNTHIPVLGSEEHDLGVVGWREVPACGDKFNGQLKPRDDTVASDGKRTNINFVPFAKGNKIHIGSFCEQVPVDPFLVEVRSAPNRG
jgi:hypothetical protein